MIELVARCVTQSWTTVTMFYWSVTVQWHSLVFQVIVHNEGDVFGSEGIESFKERLRHLRRAPEMKVASEIDSISGVIVEKPLGEDIGT